MLFWQGGAGGGGHGTTHDFHLRVSSCAGRKTKGGGCEQWSSLKGRGTEQRLLVLIKNHPLAKFEGVSGAWAWTGPAGNGFRGETGTGAAGCPQHCWDLLPHVPALPQAWVLPHAWVLPSPLPLPRSLSPGTPLEPRLHHPLVTPSMAMPRGEPSSCPPVLRCPWAPTLPPEQGTPGDHPLPALCHGPYPPTVIPQTSSMGLIPSL